MKVTFLYFVPIGALFFALWMFDIQSNEPNIESELLPQRAQLTTAATGVVALSVANINQRVELSQQRLILLELELDKLDGGTDADTHIFTTPAIDAPVIPPNDTQRINRLIPYFSNSRE